MKSEGFDAHPAWTTLASLEDELRQLGSPESDEQRYAFRRVGAAADLALTHKNNDPVLVEQQALDELNNHLTQLANHVRSFVADRVANASHIDAASNYVPNVLATIRNHFPYLPSDEVTAGAKGAATRYRNSLDAELDEIQSAMQGLKEGIEANRTEAAEATDQVMVRLEAAKGEVEGLATQLNARLENQATAFETAETARTEKFKEIEAEFRESFESLVSTEKERADELLGQLTEHEKTASSLVDTTSKHAISGDYKTWAAMQAKSAGRWTFATVVIGIAVFASLVTLAFQSKDWSAGFAITKATIAAVGLIVAGYAARQAAEHRREERIAKKLALDLDALEPFLRHVQEPDQLRTEIAKRVFVPEPSEHGAGERRLSLRRQSLSLAEVIELLKSVQNQS